MAITDATYDDVRLWTEGPEEYDPNDYYGDRHNDPGLTHLTANAFVDNYTLQRVLIHEAAHGIGVASDYEAAMLEETCLGVTE